MSTPRAARNQAIDWLRGAVMILMALDHSRMFVGSAVDLRTAAPALYFTRWITHFCAPVFVLLAGMAAYLHGQRLGSTRALSRYLLTRGLWLAFLEVTVVRAVWICYLGPEILVLQVIWAIGVSMVVLAGLVWLPRSAIAAFALALIAGHNLFDAVHARAARLVRWLWLLLHEEGRLEPLPRRELDRRLPAGPVGRGDGGRICDRTLGAAAPRARRARFLRAGVALIGGFGCCARPTSMGIRTPGRAEGGAAARAALVPRLREVSSLAPLPRDDARPGALRARVDGPAARPVGRRAWPSTGGCRCSTTCCTCS